MRDQGLQFLSEFFTTKMSDLHERTKELETALARGILGGDYGEGDTVLVDPDSRTAKLVLRVAKAGEVQAEVDGDEPTGGVGGEAVEVA